MLDELRAEANNLGISQKVYFAGYLNSKDVQKMYRCSDISVFPSTYEPFRNCRFRSNASWSASCCI